jgi:DNA polymerase III gamma/tau subunit
MELYKTYRPTSFDSIAGNKKTVDEIRTYIAKDKLPHSLLFTGEKGTGKTTLARIIAKELGCSEFDYTELDSQAESGVDHARLFTEKLKSRPTPGSKCRVFLVDEAHALSKQSMDAFLRPIESDTFQNYIIFCTTEPNQLTSTLKSRCTQYNLESLDAETIARDVLLPVCKAENIHVSKEILMLIGSECAGSSREALTMLNSILYMPENQMEPTLREKLNKTEQCNALCQAINKGATFRQCVVIAESTGKPPEAIRLAILGYFSACLAKTGLAKYYDILTKFEQNYYSSGKAGLLMSLYDVCNK